MTTNDIFSPSARGRLILWCMGFFFLALFAGSFAYRLANPSLTVPGNPADASHGPDTPQGQMPGQLSDADMDAIGTLMRQVGENPGDLQALEELSERFMQMGAWDNAENFLNQALVLEPGNTHVLFLLGVCAFQTDRHQDSAAFFEQVVALDPQDIQAVFNLGILYKHFLEREDEGRELLAQVVQSPDAAPDMVEHARQELAD